MKKRIGLWLGFSLCLSVLGFGQSQVPEIFGNYVPLPNLEPGTTYAQRFIPSEFEIVMEEKAMFLLKNNEHLLTDLVEGKDYEIRLEIIEVKPEDITITFERPTEVKVLPTEFFINYLNWETVASIDSTWNIGDTIVNKVTIKNPYNRFIPVNEKQVKRLENCLNSRPEAYLWYFQEVQSIRVKQRKVVHQIKDKYWLESIGDTVFYKSVEYKFDTTYKIIKNVIPAAFDTFQVVHFFNENIEGIKTNEVIRINKMIQKFRISEWVEVRCPSCTLTDIKIIHIQRALKKRDYVVPLDNQWSFLCKIALIDFQEKNNLPIGQLDRETLEALDIF